MTVLIGMINDARTDVALIADRLSRPTEMGLALGFTADQMSDKTARLGCQCAIALSGNALPHEITTRHLDGLANGERQWTLPEVREELDVWLPAVAFAVPLFNTMTLLLAGQIDGHPVIASYSKAGNWVPQPYFHGFACSSPVPSGDFETQRQLKAILDEGGDWIGRMQAGVAFCADRYGSVNRSYILRRLSNGFLPEEGEV